MGDLKVAETFQDAVFITLTATGVGQGGLVPTCTFVKIADNTRTAGTVQEVGSGWYRVTDFQADAIGAWTTEWAVAGAHTIHLAFKIFKAGAGQILDIFDRIGAPAGASIAADLVTIDTLIDGIVADIGVFPTANYATLAAYVEDIRTRLIAILADVTGLAGAAMRGTDGAALVADGWDAALATILDNFTAVRIGYLDELDFTLQEAIAAIQAEVDNLDGATMRGTDGAATAAIWTNALATILGNFTAVRIGYLDELDFALQEAIAALQTDLDNPNQYKADVSVLEGRLTAVRAGYLDQLDFNLQEAIAAVQAEVNNIDGAAMRGTDNAATVADGWDAALATILDNFTAVRIGYLDELDFGLQEKLVEIDAEVEGLAGAAMRGTDGAALVASGWDAALATILDNFSALRIGYLDRLQGHVNKTTFWSNSQEELAVTDGAADQNLPSIPLPNIIGTIVRVFLAFKFRMVENTNAGANKLNGAQSIRIKTDGGAWGVDDIAAIDFVDDQFSIAATTREGGDVIIGDNDLVSEVTAFNDTYDIRWENADADLPNLQFNDVQVGLVVEWY